MRSFESTLFEYIDMIKMQLRAQPLNLGGVSGVTASGVSSGPPGGYVGYLPQYRVSYDPIEDATLSNASGVSLIDNMNHIRYRLQVLEASGVGGAGSITVIDDVSSTTYPGVTVLEFDGSITSSAVTGGVKITVTASGTSVPSAHHTTHELGGSDIIKLDDLGTPDDNTDLNASTTRHGLLPKLPADSSQFLNGVGNWVTVSGTGGTGSTDILMVQVFS